MGEVLVMSVIVKVQKIFSPISQNSRTVSQTYLIFYYCIDLGACSFSAAEEALVLLSER